VTAQAEARLRLEHLRGGVPLPPRVSPWVFGRTGLLTKLVDLLDTVATKGSRTYALAANYGDGKTHTLRALWHAASERNFAVSTLALTRETPLERLDRIYPKLIADTYLPGASQPGIARLLLDIGAGSAESQQLLAWAHTELHPKLHAVLRNLLEGQSTEATEVLLQDLERMDLGIGALQRIHRGNFNAPLRLTRFSPQRDVRDYLRLVDHLLRLRGHAGWVILLDEAELIGRLGRGARARSYANIGRLGTDGMGASHLLTVFAVASNFYTDVLQRRRDDPLAPEWLASRGDGEGAEFCRRGLAILQEAEVLHPLQPANWLQLLQQLLDAHEAAYGWSSGLSPEAFWEAVRRIATETDTKVRVRLRLAIQYLDLMYQYGHAPHVRAVHDGGEVDLGEEPGDGPAEEPGEEGEAAAQGGI
jgi:hypothetical protein